MINNLRTLNNELVKYYEIELENYMPITLKTYKLSSTSGNLYFLKETSSFTLNKYQFLESMGVNNVLYPVENIEHNFITNFDNKSIFINNFYDSKEIREDIQAYNMFEEINKLHNSTKIKKILDPAKARPKFDELSNQLDYKFKLIETAVRKYESKPLNMFSMPILENYHYILDSKKELIKLQKRIISSIKARESVDYNFIHNNPSLDHMLNVRGTNYLTSLDKAKMGISSLDIAKFYVKNENLDVDFKTLILDNYYNEYNLFYYDYFRYLVLVIYIKSINISQEDFANASTFQNLATSLKKYFNSFSDYKEQTSNPN